MIGYLKDDKVYRALLGEKLTRDSFLSSTLSGFL